jgi:hypothetical protein
MLVIAALALRCLHGRVSWRPKRGKPGMVECTKHGQEFQRGHACPMCGEADADEDVKVSEASALAIEAKRRKLPNCLDNEVNWHRLAKKLEKKGDATDNGELLAKAKFYDCAMKALRQATVLCTEREDWQRIERSERNALGQDQAEEVANVSPPSGVH